MALLRRKPRIEEIDTTGEVRIVRKEVKPLPTWAKITITLILLYLVITLLTPVNPLAVIKYVVYRIADWLNTYQQITFRRWVWFSGFIILVWLSARLFYYFMPMVYLVDENKFLTVFRTREGEADWTFYVFEWVDWPPRPRLYRFTVPAEWVEFHYKMYVIRHPKGEKLIRLWEGRTVRFDTEKREAVKLELLEKELRQTREALKALREENLRLFRMMREVCGGWSGESRPQE